MDDRQHAAVRPIAPRMGNEATAAAVGVSSKTISRWKQLPDFKKLVVRDTDPSVLSTLQVALQATTRRKSRLADASLGCTRAGHPSPRRCTRPATAHRLDLQGTRRVNAVDDFHRGVTDEPSLYAFLQRHGLEATDALVVATPSANGEMEILAAVDHLQPRSASIIVLPA